MSIEMDFPVYEDIIAARRFISSYLPSTPLVGVHSLSQLLDFDYHIKCENLQPVGAFKVRGGVNLVGNLPDEERRRGVVTASTGNHGQSIAFAGRLFEVPVIIYAPQKKANLYKIESMRRLGAEVRLFGEDYDQAREEVERLTEAEGQRYVHSANEPLLVSGVGTMGMEIIDDLPQVDVVIVPVGGGSGACGIALAVKQHNPDTLIVGVQSASAPACHEAWKARDLDVDCSMTTEHEGLATRVPFSMTMQLMWDLLDDFVLVTDEEINQSIRFLAQYAHQVAEGAGAAATAAAVKLKDQLKKKTVVGILSGGNLPLARFATVLTE